MNILEINKTKILIDRLIKLDDELYNKNKNKNKNKQNKLVFKGYRSKKFVFLDATFRIKRRIYLDPITRKYIYLLDKTLNLDKYTHYDNEFTNKIFSLIYEDKISYSSVQKYTGIKMHKGVVCNFLKKRVV